MVFFNKLMLRRNVPTHPRAFLLALTRLAPSHALLIAYWGADGTTALSVSTREYFQFAG